MSVASKEQMIQMDISEFQNGVYIISLVNPKMNKSFKIIKQTKIERFNRMDILWKRHGAVRPCLFHISAYWHSYWGITSYNSMPQENSSELFSKRENVRTLISCFESC